MESSRGKRNTERRERKMGSEGEGGMGVGEKKEEGIVERGGERVKGKGEREKQLHITALIL